jgi:hypothetical protein
MLSPASRIMSEKPSKTKNSWKILWLGCGGIFPDKFHVARVLRAILKATDLAFQTQAASMQQKYFDHGRSWALSAITLPILRARSSCVSGGKVRIASILRSIKSCLGWTGDVITQLISFAGSRPRKACLGQIATGKVYLFLESRVRRLQH